MSRHHKVAIAGSGLAALAAAAKLHENGVKDIAIYANGLGGTPYIAAINFVLPFCIARKPLRRHARTIRERYVGGRLQHRQ